MLQAIAAQIKLAQQTPDWYKDSFPAQKAFIQDPARLKAARCTRRAGKSYAAGLILFKAAWMSPKSAVLYLALSKDSAKRIMWQNILKQIDRDFNLGATFLETEQVVKLPNESVIYLLGADAKPDEMNKLLGQKFVEVVIDEASKYHINVRKLVYDVVKSTTIDSLGRVSMIGTTDNFVRSFFAEVTLGKERGWSLHHWTSRDNQHVAAQIDQEIAELRMADPNVESKPWFRQNYMAMWDVDESALVYRYPQSSVVSAMPGVPNINYYLGVIIAYRGCSTFAVVAESTQMREAYIVEAYRREITDIYAVLDECLKLQQAYKVGAIVCLDASDRLQAEIVRRSPITVENVVQKDRQALLQLFCSELGRNNIKVLESNTDIIEEWNTVVKDERAPNGTIREHPANPSEIASAAVLAWSKCSNYSYTPPKEAEDVMQAYWDRLERQIHGRSDEDEINDEYGWYR